MAFADHEKRLQQQFCPLYALMSCLSNPPSHCFFAQNGALGGILVSKGNYWEKGYSFLLVNLWALVDLRLHPLNWGQQSLPVLSV